MFTMNRRKLLFALVPLAALAACGGGGEPPAVESQPEEFAIHGQIIELQPDNQVAVIEHDEIVGWMGAMRMAFPIRDQAEFDKLAEGDWIDGTVYVDGFDYAVGSITVVEPPAEEEAPPEEQ